MSCNAKPDTEMGWYQGFLRKKLLHNWDTDALLPCATYIQT